MVADMPYKDLTDALRFLRVQVIEGIPYVKENFPRLDSPKKIFDYLKKRLSYKNDPPGIEHFHTLQSLFETNIHGTPGAGDCDCFTIAALSTLIANGFENVGIVLAGRSPLNAVHIWAYADVNGVRYDLDLTNKKFNTTRRHKYNFFQSIPFVLSLKEKEQMRLSLSDGKASYIYFPDKGVQVREDYFDGMNAGEFQSMCLSEGISLEEIEELSGRRADRKAGELRPGQKRRMTKKAAKQVVNAQKPRNVRRAAKTEAKVYKIKTGADSRGAARIMKATPAPRSSPAPTGPEQSYQGAYADQEQEFLPEDQYYQEPDQEQEFLPEEIYQDEQPMEEGNDLLKGVGLILALGIAGKFLEGKRKTA